MCLDSCFIPSNDPLLLGHRGPGLQLGAPCSSKRQIYPQPYIPVPSSSYPHLQSADPSIYLKVLKAGKWVRPQKRKQESQLYGSVSLCSVPLSRVCPAVPRASGSWGRGVLFGGTEKMSQKETQGLVLVIDELRDRILQLSPIASVVQRERVWGIWLLASLPACLRDTHPEKVGGEE